MGKYHKIIYSYNLDELEKRDRARYILIYYLSFEVRKELNSRERINENDFVSRIKAIRRKSQAKALSDNVIQSVDRTSVV